MIRRVEKIHPPNRYQAAVDSFTSKRTFLEDGSSYTETAVSNDSVIHAEWTPWPRRPPRGVYFLSGDDKRYSWCGTRLKAILPENFREGDVRACSECLAAFDRGAPEDPE